MRHLRRSPITRCIFRMSSPETATVTHPGWKGISELWNQPLVPHARACQDENRKMKARLYKDVYAFGGEEKGVEKRRIMIIDDDAAFLAETSDMLRDAGYAVQTVDSKREAMRSLEAGDLPELILLDYVMEENGGKLAARLKSQERTSHIPIIMVSARSMKEITENLDSRRKGAIIHGFMRKPIDPLDLLSVIETNLDR
jgi:CheY-like chemotaxis protein